MRPMPLRDTEPVGEPGSALAVPLNPNSRLGRHMSPFVQGWGTMEATALFVGIDVSKDRLDVHVHGRDEWFDVPRDTEGIAALVERLRALAPQINRDPKPPVGFENVVVASLAVAGLPVVVVNPAQVRAFANALGKRAKTDAIDAAVIARFVAGDTAGDPACQGRRDPPAGGSRRPQAPDPRHDQGREPAARKRAATHAKEQSTAC